MVVDFMEAALPWILLGLFVAISCSFISKTNDYMEEWDFENWGILYWSKTEEFLKYLAEHS